MTSTTFKPKLNLSPGAQARVALMRFGLGPKPGVAARLSTEDGAAFQACLNEIYNPATLLIPDDQVKTYCTDTQADVVLDYATCCRFGANWPWKPPSTGFLPQPLNIITAETAARFAKGLEPDVGFAERLVHFWSNHFSIHGSKTVMVRSVVGHFERSVIRPGVLGKFSDLLKAVYQHPAMICNLENERSIGLNSPYGKDPRNKTRVVDINENLAREIFELHTLGIDGGHRQADVVNFAKVLSGWTIYGGAIQRRVNSISNLPSMNRARRRCWASPTARQVLTKVSQCWMHWLGIRLPHSTLPTSSSVISSPTNLRPPWSPTLPGCFVSLVAIFRSWPRP